VPPATTPPIQQRVDQRRRTSNLSLNFKLGAVAAVAVFTVIVGSLGVVVVRESSDAWALVSQTQQVQQSLSAVLQRLTDAETGQRGYLLSNSDEFLEPFNGATTDVTQTLARLRELVKVNDSQVRALSALNEAVETRITTLNAHIDGRRLGDVLSVELLRPGKQQMDRVQTLVRSMRATEATLLAERQMQTDRWGVIAIAVLFAGSLGACALLIVISTAIRRDVALQEAARIRIAEQNTELEAQSQTLADQQIELDHQVKESQAITGQLQATNLTLHRSTEMAEREREDAIEARDLVKASESRYRFMADTIPVQVWTAAADGQLDFVSEGVAHYFGRTREEMLGEGWLAVIHPDDVSPVVERWTHALATGQPYEVKFRLRRHDGTYRWHIGQALAQRDDNQTICGWFGSNTDVDDQHRDSARRERLVRSVERTNQELDQFAYVASHDLKATLRGIGNLSEWIEEDIGPSFPASAREKMELLRGRVRRVEALIDGMLEYSRAGRVRNPPTSVDTNALLNEVLEVLAFPETVRVQVDTSLPHVVTEHVPLQQVFGNLLGNAVKNAGRTDVALRVAGTIVGEFVHFAVTDNGPGIAPQYHDRIFVMFQRLAARDKIEGTGAGLAIVKKIVESRDGRVWVQSPSDEQTGSGTTFHFTWPTVPGPKQ